MDEFRDRAEAEPERAHEGALLPARRPRKQRAPQIVWRRAFLAVYRETCNIRVACEAAGICRDTVKRARQTDPLFNQRFLEAQRDAIDLVEARAREGATIGWKRPIIYQGKVVGEYREISEKMILAILRAYRPHLFQDARPLGVASGQDPEMEEETEGIPVEIPLEELTDEELGRLKELLIARQEKGETIDYE